MGSGVHFARAIGSDLSCNESNQTLSLSSPPSFLCFFRQGAIPANFPLTQQYTPKGNTPEVQAMPSSVPVRPRPLYYSRPGRGLGWAPSSDQEGRREGALLPPHTQSLSRIYRESRLGARESRGAVQKSSKASFISGRTVTTSRQVTRTEAAGTMAKSGRGGQKVRLGGLWLQSRQAPGEKQWPCCVPGHSQSSRVL